MQDIWAGTSGPRDAEIAIVGEAFGSEEAIANQPFVGPSGGVLDGMLEEVGIRRDACFLTNVVNARPPANDLQEWFEPGDATVSGLRPGLKVREGVSALFAQLDAIKPKIVLAFGPYALWALTRHAGSTADGPRARVPTGILDWRGSQVWMVDSRGDRLREPTIGSGVDGPVPVLPLVHPAAILRDWSLRVPTVHDLRTRVPLALSGKWRAEDRDPPLKIEALLTFDRAWAVIGSLLSLAEVRAANGQFLYLSTDIETFRAHLITCIGFATSDANAVSLPFVALTGNKERPLRSFWTVQQEAMLVVMVAKLLAHPAVRLIGQNWLYDRAFIWEWFRVDAKPWWDTLVAQNLLLPGTQKDLGYMASLYCRYMRFWKRDSRDWLDGTDTMGLEQHLIYNGEDCARTFEVAVEQKRALYEVQPDRNLFLPQGRLRLWESDELPSIEFAWEMQRRGMRVNQEARGRLAMDLIEARSALGAWVETVAPQTLLDAEGATPSTGTRWRDSPKQAAVLLYEVLGLRVQRNRKTGSVSTDDEAIGTLKEAHPRLAGLFDALLEYRSLGVLFATFVEAKLDPDGRFRSSFNPAGTATFRFSSSKNPFKRGGNFQNVPGSEEA